MAIHGILIFMRESSRRNKAHGTGLIEKKDRCTLAIQRLNNGDHRAVVNVVERACAFKAIYKLVQSRLLYHPTLERLLHQFLFCYIDCEATRIEKFTLF